MRTVQSVLNVIKNLSTNDLKNLNYKQKRELHVDVPLMGATRKQMIKIIENRLSYENAGFMSYAEFHNIESYYSRNLENMTAGKLRQLIKQVDRKIAKIGKPLTEKQSSSVFSFKEKAMKIISLKSN